MVEEELWEEKKETREECYKWGCRKETEATEVIGGGNHSLSYRDDADGHVEGKGGGEKTVKIHLLKINVQGNKVDDLKRVKNDL